MGGRRHPGFRVPPGGHPDFIAHATEEYAERILPPFFRALRRFEDHHRYSWHTPAHAGGVAFLKSPVGRAFFDFYGERLLRTDLSISVPELGSPLDHTGPIGDAARVFGAERTFFVMNGNANRMVGHHAIARDEFATQSTHKHLAALSQSAMVHIRSAPRAPVDFDRFNETYLTAPMIASLDVAAGMMDGPAGPYLTGEAIIEAVRFRQTASPT